MTNAGKTIFHVTTRKEWEDAILKGYYEAASLATEGFIHCSEAEQVAGVLDRYFPGKFDLLKLSIDPSRLQCELRYEHSPSVDQHFPHVYGRINLDAVIMVEIVNGIV
jgi:uncharacterized protein (DUF952 family)